MKPVRFHFEAEAELRAALARLEIQRKGLGREFRLEVEAAVARIQEDPLAYAVSDEDDETRFCMVRRFPYTIYYVEFPDHIWVAAVAHQHRRPGYWIRSQPE